jgi:hypothetical protein
MTSHLLAAVLFSLFVLSLIVFRLAWGASSLASLAALGRINLPPRWRHWLLGEK